MNTYRTAPRTAVAGFTIIEILITTTIIAVLAAVTVVAYRGIVARAKDSAMESNISNLIKKTGEISAETGSINASLLVGTSSGAVNPDQLRILRENGLSIDALRHPRASPRETTSIYFNGLYNNTHLLDLPDDAMIKQPALPEAIPGGFATWYDAITSLDRTVIQGGPEYDQWRNSVEGAMEQWETAHPWNENASEEEQKAYMIEIYTAIANIYMSFPLPNDEATRAVEAYATLLIWNARQEVGDDTTFVMIPKKNIYIAELLGATAAEDSCSGRWNYSESTSNITVVCGQDTHYDATITGVRIHYYSEVQKKWLSKSYGSGTPFANYDNYLMRGWGQ